MIKMRAHTASYLRGLVFVGLGAAGAMGCSSDGSGGIGSGVSSLGPNGDGTGTRPLAAPAFQFEPGPPGRAVGVRAIVSLDGTELTSEPIELALGDPPNVEKRARPRRSGGSVWGSEDADRASAGTELGMASEGLSQCPSIGQEVTEMGTINGQICYAIVAGAVGVIGLQKAFLATTFFAREGIYAMGQVGTGQSVPPSFANITATLSYGCIAGDQPGALGTEYYGGLSSLSFARGLRIPLGWSLQVGNTYLIQPGKGIQRALQMDVALDYSASILPFAIGATFMSTETVRQANFVRPWNGQCGAQVTNQNAVEYVRDQMTGWLNNGTDDGLEDTLAQQVAESSLPLFQSLSDSGEGGLADNVAAGSNADYYSEYLSIPGTQLPADAPNTSADALTLRAQSRLRDAGDDTGALLVAGAQSLNDVNQNMPSLLSQATLQREAATGSRAVEELDRLHQMDAPGVQTFIAQDVKKISTPSGEQAHFSVSAAEIAALVGRPASDVNNATIVVNAGTAIQEASFFLQGEQLALNVDIGGEGLLVRFDVDLSTADGDFPDNVAQWVVRPAMVLIEVAAGSPAAVILTGPGQLSSGGPASLSAQVIDENGRRVKRPFSVRFVDGSGQEVGAVDSEGETALLQYVPEPSAPVIAETNPTSINSGGDSGPGIEIAGTGFSKDAQVLLDGTPLVAGTDFQVSGPESILIRFPATLAAGSHTLRVTNPRGLASSDVAFTVP
jgi:hypothetical protein